MNIDRYYSSVLRPYGRLSKPVKLVNKKYREWVASRACVVSGYEGEEVVPHHHQLKAQIQNDYTCVPLRSDLHNQLHSGGVQTFEEVNVVNLDHALIAQLIERILELEAQMKGR